jgi:nucleoside phosphorylase
MKYEEILEYLKKYGSNREDIIKRRGYEKVLKNVVIAPWWEHTIFENYCERIEKVGKKTYNVYCEGISFSFIEVRNIGDSALLEELLALGVTECNKILFIGSAGAIDEGIEIGDLVVPMYSFNGVGATRYLNDNLEDDFEIKYYPSKKLTDCLLETISNMGYSVRLVGNYSVDSILAQFPHINHIRNLGAKTLEMETSTLFKASNIMGIDSTALFVISDNTVNNKSLYAGRSDGECDLRKKVRKTIVPNIVIAFFKKQ